MAVHFPRLFIALRIVASAVLLPLSSGWGPVVTEITHSSAICPEPIGLPSGEQRAVSSLLIHKDTDYHFIATDNRFYITRQSQSLEADITLAGYKVRTGELSAADPWVEQGMLTVSDGAEWDVFGSAVAISEDTIVLGAAGGDG